MPRSIRPAFTCNIVMLGDSNVGKTALFTRLRDGVFRGSEAPTVGIDWEGLEVEVDDNVKAKVHMFDTAGLPNFRAMYGSYYKRAAAIVLVYDITNNTSWLDIQQWEKEAKENGLDRDVPIMVIGNKADRELERQVSREDVNEFLSSRTYLNYETSAVTGQNVEQVLTSLTREIYERFANGVLKMRPDWEGITEYYPNDNPLVTKVSREKAGCIIL